MCSFWIYHNDAKWIYNSFINSSAVFSSSIPSIAVYIKNETINTKPIIFIINI